MAPNKGSNAGKAAAKAAKKAKQADKAAKKEAQALKSANVKGKGKGKQVLEDEEDDLEAILQRYQEEMQAVIIPTVTTLESPPPPRTNALLLPSPSVISAEPSSNHLYLMFGEFFDGSRATFYSSVMRYDIAKDEWREYKSSQGPAPRSSAAGVGVPGLGEGGGILIFGGEYASPTQTSFHHYKDLWLFSMKTHSWDRIDTKRGPSGRSGHRMIVWKQYVILFGGFIDVGIKTNYLSDLWIFDTIELKWKQIEYIDRDQAPGPRSGFSFIPCQEGAILYGGYRKEYVKGMRAQGLALDDTWLLRMDLDLGKLKWERRKRIGYAPSLRSGCSMTHWTSKGMGVLFGGVLDEENEDEDMTSTFYNDLFAYNPEGKGRWVSLNLRKRKKMGGRRRRKREEANQDSLQLAERADEDVEMQGEEEDADYGGLRAETDTRDTSETVDEDDDDPAKSKPLTRYNAMLAIVKNTLFIYGGIFETTIPSREYTLDDFVTLNLEKLDRYVHIRGTGIEELEAEWRGSDDEDMDDGSSEDGSSDQDSDEDGEDEEEDIDDDEDDDEAEREKRHAALSQAEKDALRQRATQFLGVSKDTARPEEDVLSTPLPDENLRAFYERSRSFWANTAYARTGARGKALRREGFQLARSKYEDYKPLLEEIERIQREAELDKAEAAASKRTATGVGERNRR